MPVRNGGRPPPRDASDDPPIEQLPGELSAETKAGEGLLQAVLAARRHDLNAETRIRAAIVAWVSAEAPEVQAFHPANGVWRSKTSAAASEGSAWSPGFQTWSSSDPAAEFVSLEVKAASGSISADQHAVFERLAGLGARVAVVRSIDDTPNAFASWGIQMRGARQ
jgi:hypothetical protein